MSAFVHSSSLSQARLMFVTTLEMDNFDCTKTNAHFKKFTAYPSPALKAPVHSYQLGWAYGCETCNKYSLGHCGLSAASRHKPFTRRHYTLLTATNTTALYPI